MLLVMSFHTSLKSWRIVRHVVFWSLDVIYLWWGFVQAKNSSWSSSGQNLISMWFLQFIQGLGPRWLEEICLKTKTSGILHVTLVNPFGLPRWIGAPPKMLVGLERLRSEIPLWNVKHFTTSKHRGSSNAGAAWCMAGPGLPQQICIKWHLPILAFYECKDQNSVHRSFQVRFKKLDHTLARKNDSPTWCGVIVVVWCYCGGVVLLWWCGVTVVVWCYCGSVLVVV